MPLMIRRAQAIDLTAARLDILTKEMPKAQRKLISPLFFGLRGVLPGILVERFGGGRASSGPKEDCIALFGWGSGVALLCFA